MRKAALRFPVDHLRRSRFNDDDEEEYAVPELSASEKLRCEEYINAPERTYQEKAFLTRMTGKLSKGSLDALLYSIPGMESFPTFETVHGVFANDIRCAFNDTAKRFGEDVEERCKEYCATVKNARSRYLESMAAVRRLASSDITEEVLDLLESASQEMKQSQNMMMQSLTEVAAKRCLERARVTGYLVHFPRPVDCVSGFLTTSALTGEAYDVFSNMVSQKISSILLDRETFTGSKAKGLVLQIRERPLVEFLFAKLSYIPDLWPCDRFSEEYFLTYKDQIVKPYKISKIDKQGIRSARVVIQLGSDKTPPKTLVQDRYRERLQRKLESFRSLSNLDYLREMIDSNPLYNLPFAEFLSPFEMLLERRLMAIESLESEIVTLSKRPPFSPLENPFRMKMETVYAKKHCFLCHTTSHTIRDCEYRACKLCSSMKHMSFKCTLKCACKIGPLHSMEECPRSKIEGLGRS